MAGKRTEGRHIYRMKKELISIEDYWIENENGEKVFYVDGELFRNAQRNGLYKIWERFLPITDTIDIKRMDDDIAATIKKKFATFWTDKWKIETPNGPDMEIRGSISSQHYTIYSKGEQIAEISKKGFHIRDTYEVEIKPGQDNELILAIAAGLAQTYHLKSEMKRLKSDMERHRPRTYR